MPNTIKRRARSQRIKKQGIARRARGLRIEKLESRRLLAAVLFDPNAVGDNTRSVEEWGVDTAWPSEENVRWSVENIGVDHVDIVRVNFFTDEALNPDGSLGPLSQASLNNQLALATQYAPGKPIAMTPSIGFDHTDPSYLDADGNANPDALIELMKASQIYVEQATGVQVVAIEPFNEPDLWPGQGTPEILNTIMTKMVADPFFDGVLIQGASTLASENSYYWYDRIREPAMSGTTHLLGSGPDALASYAGFFPYVKSNGTDHSPDDIPYNPEIHSMAEMIVGADRGMEGGIFWAIVERPRALFVTTSDGNRLGYAEDLTDQTAAAVYRGLDGEIRGFAGGIERAGTPTQFEFTSTTDPVYFNGIGPIQSYSALAQSDQQTAIEIDTNQAEAQPPLDGYRWKIINRASGGVLDLFAANPNDGGNIQLWEDNGGLNQLWNIRQQHGTYNGFFRVDDYLYLTNASSGRLAEVANFSLDDNANVQQYGVEAEYVSRHWYIEPTGEGYFSIRNANSNKYLSAESNDARANVIQDSYDGTSLQQWEFVLTNPDAASGLQLSQDLDGGFSTSTTTGNPSFNSGPGDIGSSMVFDGVDDFVQLGSSVVQHEDITVASWVKWNGGNAWQRIFDFGNNTDQYMMMTPSSASGRLKFAITTTGYTNELELQTDSLSVGTWHHVAVTLGGNTAVLYVDGRAITAGQIPTNLTDFNPTQNYIGKSQFADPLFNGQVSEFQIFDFALSADQISNLVNTGRARLDLTAGITAQSEGDSGTTEYQFEVTRSGDLNLNASATYAISGATLHPADADDFGGTFPYGTISFSPGETTKTVSIFTSGDLDAEFDEGFSVTLINPGTATWIIAGSITGTILNDDIESMFLSDEVLVAESLPLTKMTLTGTSELHLTGTVDPIHQSIVQLNSLDGWLFFDHIKPSEVVSNYINQILVNGEAAVLDSNVRAVQYGQGTVIVPHQPNFTPLEVFYDPYFQGDSAQLSQYTSYDHTSLGILNDAISSFKLKRGYTATFANNPDGTGGSINYVAQDGDLEIPLLPELFNDGFSFVRVFPWRWTTKKGIAGNIDTDQELNTQWWYNWNIDQNSSLDQEYVAIRQARWWPGLGQDWNARGVNHLLGYNEPDQVNQANILVGDAVWSWPDLESTGLRLGAPAVSDGGLNSWLYPFMDQIEQEGKRVDFVPVHYYRSYSNPNDPTGAANQFYNFLKGIYDRVQRPLWVTEWNNGASWTGDPDPTFEQQAATINAIQAMLEAAPFVERYSLYNWVEDVRRVRWDDGTLTLAGEVYRDQVSNLAYQQNVPAPDTISDAKYTFDGDTFDQSGNGHASMRVGTPSFDLGVNGTAISLDGENDYIQLSSALGDTEDFTFTSWVRWDGGANWQRIFDLGFDTNQYLFLTPAAGDGKLRFAINDGSGEQSLSHSEPLPVGKWTHVAVTIAGSTGSLYVNGEKVATNASMTVNPVDVNSLHNYLGKSQFTADPLLNGSLDDVHFFTRALGADEIHSLAATIASVKSARVTSAETNSITITWDAPYETHPIDQSVLNFFDASYPDWANRFGSNSTTVIALSSDPVQDQLNNGPSGQQWLAQGDGYDFKLTIEDATGITIESLVSELERLPEPYLRAYAEVSGPVGENGISPEDGVAIYNDLAGAAGHGSQFYLNLHRDVISNGWAGVTAHEAGHVLQQVADTNNPTADYLLQWENAAISDNRSISPYGDSSYAEELAEFAMFYAVALDLESRSDSDALDQLFSLSPARFALWEEILQYDSGTMATGYRIETSIDDGATWNYLGETTSDVTTWTDNGLVPGSEHYYRVRASHESRLGQWGTTFASTSGTALPSPWNRVDVGLVGGPGTAMNTGAGTWTLVDAGSDIWNTEDSFQFAYQTVSGDAEIVARIDTLEATHPFAKAGVMIRQSTDANAPMALVSLTRASELQMIRRLEVDGNATLTAQPGISAPNWVRLVRDGDQITGYESADGLTWNLVDTFNLQLPDTALIGIAVTSHNLTKLNTSTFSEVELRIPGVTVTSTSNLETGEDGSQASFSVQLDSQPTDVVNITATSTVPTEGVPTPNVLSFNSTNWNIPQTVTITGVDDFIVDGPIAYEINLSISGGSSLYNKISIPNLSVTNLDDDAAGVTVSPTEGLVTTEDGGAAEFTMTLTSQPSAEVSIGISSSNESEGIVTPTNVIFTPANWNQAQTVHIKGQSDTTADGNILFTVITAPAISDDPFYNGLDPENVAIVNIDVPPPTMDFGDAPAGYPVSLEMNGARHFVGDLRLGSTIDIDDDGINSPLADQDSDDGVVAVSDFIALPDQSTMGGILVTASAAGKLDAWIDFNGDGDWADLGERIFMSQPLVTGDNLLGFDIPAGASAGTAAARFRLSSGGSLAVTGEATDGEVEDYLITIVDGTATQDVSINATLGPVIIDMASGEMTAISGSAFFRVPLATINSLLHGGSSSNDRVTLQFGSDFILPLNGFAIQGNEDDSVIKILGDQTSVDLTDPRLAISKINHLDLTDVGHSSVRLDSAVISQLSPETEIVIARTGEGDKIHLNDSEQWRMTTPKLVNDEFYLVAHNTAEGGTKVIEASVSNPWQNFLQTADINNDGRVTAGDALRVINELAARRYSNDPNGQLITPNDIASWPSTFFDQSGDNRVTALDALQVINTLARVQSGAEGEWVTLQDVPTNNTDRSLELLDTEVVPSFTPNNVETLRSVTPRQIGYLIANETTVSLTSLKEQKHDQVLSDPDFLGNLSLRSIITSGDFKFRDGLHALGYLNRVPQTEP